ncbi:nuclear pore membrane glycoprotein 210 [Schistocerca serialis cubense]|uniref:nuclear pore membrane glycoprotein 210 n=1 Tax=Schistocerca serialis cubense TaxID=2023355 RepID=UPI00214F1CA2|nr:nuclear pore membrane glycoprotein 210 [Schistocerca serialis cubense]
MAGVRIWIVCLFLLLFCFKSGVLGSKLNVPRVLLPLFNSFNTNFTLEVVDAASGGCYKWTTSRPNIVQLLPVEGELLTDCMGKVVVTAVTKERVRSTAIVFAEETNSGQVLRCDVIVDVISSLAIVTTTRELFREEAPEAFEARAYDDQGNEFTTLEGVEFEWSVINWNQQPGSHETTQNNVLRFITFKDSPYETPSTVMALDNRGLQGHIVLMEGLKTGSAKISVRLPQEEYSNIPPIQVELMIVANLLIMPSDAYILTGDSVKFHIYQIQHGKLEEIINSQQYYLEMEDHSIASLDKRTNIVTGKKLGKTKVLLHDRNVNEKETGIKIPSASLTVASPAYIKLDILPHHNWAVIVEDYYEIVVEVYDKENHRLSIGDGVEVATLIPEAYFEIQTKSNNGTYVYGSPSEVGTAQVRSTLLSVTDVEGRIHAISPKISAQANLMIYKRIAITPSEVLLPWHPLKRPKYEVKLQVSGGDGNFVWQSKDTSIAVVTQAGVVRTVNQGHVEITAAMDINRNNYAVSNFHILPPRQLQIVEYLAETEVGNSIFLHVAMFAERPVESDKAKKISLAAFTQCADIPFQVQIWDEIFSFNESLKTAPIGTACSSLGITATELGTTKVTVSYTQEEITLEDSVTLASYWPLKPVNPASGVVVLAVGSARTVVFTGGPRPWIGHASEHFHHLEPTPSENDIIEVMELSNIVSDQPDVYTYRILCKQLGEAEVTLTVTNKPMARYRKRSESVATVTVYCAKPRYISLFPEIKLTEKERCPINYQNERMVVQNYKDIEVAVIVTDEQGHVFDNVSSLDIDWMVSDESLGILPNPDEMVFENLEENGRVFPSRQYQVIQPKGKTGVLEITARVVGYNTLLLRELEIIPEYPPFPVTDKKGYESTPEIVSTLSLLLVSDTIVTPNVAYVFNHPDNMIKLQVSQGSGYYELVLSSEDVADVTYVEGSRIIEIVPKTDGHLKLAMVDLCLPSKPALAEVQVSSVGSIKVEVAEHVEKGRCIPAVVHLYDTTGNVLPISDISLLNLRPLADTAVIGIKLLPDKETLMKVGSLGEVHYVITGLQLGDINLIFASGFEGNEVLSHPVPIQVFPPLKLLPRNVTLVVGSVYQINSHGGPRPASHIDYSVSSTSIATVNSVGLVEGFGQGKTVLVGKAVGINKATGQRVVYSKDSVEINVIPLAAIKINAPLNRIIVGATMPLWAHGIPEELTPLIIGCARPSLLFDWAVSAPNVVQLNNVYHETGIVLKDEDKISMRLTALRAGISTIYLNVTVPPRMSAFPQEQTVKFETSLEIEVFEELRLASPPSVGEFQSPYILMAPDTEIQLKTNHEGDLMYSVLGSIDPAEKAESSDVESIDRAVSNVTPLLTVNERGLIRSQSATGRTVVTVSVKEGFGLKQVLGVTVEVKPIHYMMINFNPIFHVAEDETVSVLPKGITADFSITYHDNTGMTFTTVESDIKLRTNRFDLVQLSKKPKDGSVHATFEQESSTMLKIWDDIVFQHSADYIKLTVGEIILPSVRTLTLGDVICFSMPLVSPDGKTGHWSTDSENILSVHPHLGIGRARLVGSVTVRHHLPNNIVTNIQLRILPVFKVKLLPTKQHILTNAYLGQSYRVPVVLCSELDKTKTVSMRSRNGTCPEGYFVTAFPFYCAIRFSDPDAEFDVDDVFAVHQRFDLEKGEYSCEILAADDPPPSLSTFEGDVILTVESGGVMSEPMTIPFMPAIYVSTPEIYLSDAEMAGTLIINGIPEVLKQVKVESENTLLTVVKKDCAVRLSSSSYRIILSDEFWKLGELSLKMNVSVISDLTCQNLQVPVKMRLKADKVHLPSPCLVTHLTSWGTYISDGLYNYRYLIVITLIVILMGTIYSYRFIAVPMATRRGESMILGPSSLQLTKRQSIYDAAGSGSISRPSNLMIRAPFSTTEAVYGDPRTPFQNIDAHRRRTFL